MKTVIATLLLYDDFSTERIEGDARQSGGASVDVDAAYPPLELESALAADVQRVFRANWTTIDETLGLSARRRTLFEEALADAHEDFPSAAGDVLDRLAMKRLQNTIMGRIAKNLKIARVPKGDGSDTVEIASRGPEAFILRLMRQEGWLDEVAEKHAPPGR